MFYLDIRVCVLEVTKIHPNGQDKKGEEDLINSIFTDRCILSDLFLFKLQ